MKKFIVAVVVVVLGFIGFNVFNESAAPTETPKGAVAGPDTYFPYVANNDVKIYSYSQNFTNLSSTTCSFKTPNATTSLQNFTLRADKIASSTVFEIGTASTPQATTTLLAGSYTKAAGTQLAMETGTTSPAYILAPNVWLTAKVGGGSIAGTDSSKFNGFCGVRLQAF